jgi:hypothetical protein
MQASATTLSSIFPFLGAAATATATPAPAAPDAALTASFGLELLAALGTPTVTAPPPVVVETEPAPPKPYIEIADPTRTAAPEFSLAMLFGAMPPTPPVEPTTTPTPVPTPEAAPPTNPVVPTIAQPAMPSEEPPPAPAPEPTAEPETSAPPAAAPSPAPAPAPAPAPSPVPARLAYAPEVAIAAPIAPTPAPPASPKPPEAPSTPVRRVAPRAPLAVEVVASPEEPATVEFAPIRMPSALEPEPDPAPRPAPLPAPPTPAPKTPSEPVVEPRPGVPAPPAAAEPIAAHRPSPRAHAVDAVAAAVSHARGTPQTSEVGRAHAAPGSAPAPVAPDAMIEAIVARAKSMPANGTVEVRFALDPQDLGSVRIHLETKGDQVRVEILAANDAALDTLGAGIQKLQRQLEDAGFRHAEIRLDLDSNPSREGAERRAGREPQAAPRDAAREHPFGDGRPAAPRSRPRGSTLDRMA